MPTTPNSGLLRGGSQSSQSHQHSRRIIHGIAHHLAIALGLLVDVVIHVVANHSSEWLMMVPNGRAQLTEADGC